MATYKRRKKLIQPRLQIRLILAFLGVALLALMLQFILFASTIATLAADLPQEGEILIERIPGYTVAVLLISIGVLLPLTFFVGILTTFRVAGPLYRFEQHLKSIARGEDPGVCRIRNGDELQDFCRTFNAALDRIRADGRMGGAAANAGDTSNAGERGGSNGAATKSTTEKAA